MNREIKFKVLLNDKSANPELEIIIIPWEFKAYDKVDLNTIRQFTGLLDKNGKEIYEDDIVKFNWNGEKIGIIKFGESPDHPNNWGWYIEILKFEQSNNSIQENNLTPFEVLNDVYEISNKDNGKYLDKVEVVTDIKYIFNHAGLKTGEK